MTMIAIVDFLDIPTSHPPLLLPSSLFRIFARILHFVLPIDFLYHLLKNAWFLYEKKTELFDDFRS